MEWPFDHVVVVVTDLAQSVRDYENAGFTVALGGRHPDTSAENAIIAFADCSYIELFSFAEPDKAPRGHANWMPFAKGGGFGAFWCRTDDVSQAASRLRGAGVDIEDGRTGSRVRPDGFRVEFRLAVPDRKLFPFAPALIEDVTPLQERVGAPPAHRNGASGVSIISCRTANPDQALQFYADLPGSGLAAPDSAAHRERAVRLGDTLVQFDSMRSAEGDIEGVESVEVKNGAGQRVVIGRETSPSAFR